MKHCRCLKYHSSLISEFIVSICNAVKFYAEDELLRIAMKNCACQQAVKLFALTTAGGYLKMECMSLVAVAIENLPDLRGCSSFYVPNVKLVAIENCGKSPRLESSVKLHVALLEFLK